MKKKCFVYMVRCADQSLYTGSAVDVVAREKKHNAGTASRYTRARLPVTVVYTETFDSWSKALRREAAIKRLPKKKKEQLILSQ